MTTSGFVLWLSGRDGMFTLHIVMNSLCFAFHQLLKKPDFTAMAVLTLSRIIINDIT